MLDRTLNFLLAQLNDHLGTRYPSKEPHAVLSSLSTLEGTAPPEIANRVVLSLVNVEREAAAGGTPTPVRNENGAFVRTSASLNLNLYVLVTASFGSNYVEALKLLSSVLGYFQGKPVFTAQGTPAFPKGLDRLTMEIVNLFHLREYRWNVAQALIPEAAAATVGERSGEGGEPDGER
jgi:hypothetical protein